MARQSFSIWPYLGLNVGADVVSGVTYTDQGLLSDAALHHNAGIRYVRIPLMAYKYSGGDYGTTRNASLQSLIQAYLAYGINVQVIISYGDGFNQASHAALYEAYLATKAAWAQSVGVQRLQIMNELEINLSGMTQAQAYTYIQTLPAIVTSAGFTGTKTCSLVPDNYASWQSGGAGNFDDVGFDSYGTIAQFTTKNDEFVSYFTTKAYLSEWGSANADADYYAKDPRYILSDVMQRFSYVKDKFPTKPCYFFTWKYFGSEGDDARAACTQNNDIRHFWYSLTGQRPLLVS